MIRLLLDIVGHGGETPQRRRRSGDEIGWKPKDDPSVCILYVALLNWDFVRFLCVSGGVDGGFKYNLRS